MTRREADRVEDALNYLGTVDAWKAAPILTELLKGARAEHAAEDRYHDLEEAVSDECPPLLEAAE